jgi:hypothetical protein
MHAHAAVMVLLLGFGMQARDFLRLCFIRDPTKRPDVTSLLLHPFVTLLPAANSRHLPSSFRPSTAGHEFDVGRNSRALRLRGDRPSPMTTPSVAGFATPTLDGKQRFPVLADGSKDTQRQRADSGADVGLKSIGSPTPADAGEPFKPPQLTLPAAWDRHVDALNVLSGRSQLSGVLFWFHVSLLPALSYFVVCAGCSHDPALRRGQR